MFIKILFVILVSSVKFIFAFPLAIGYSFNCPQTIIFTSIGGVAGVLFFAYISDLIIHIWKRLYNKYIVRISAIRNHVENRKVKKSERKLFTKRNKRFIRIKQSYGLAGIAVLTPFILSIPIGTFLAIRFYNRSKKTLLFLTVSVVFWAIVLGCITHFTDLHV